MMEYYKYLFVAVVCYISGSLMFSYWLPKIFYKVDVIKSSEDENPGTSNAMRLTSVPFGLLCLFFDIAKGALPVYFFIKRLDFNNVLFAFVIVAPVLGHAFSPFLHFKGGKCIAVSFGVMLAVLGESYMIAYLAVAYIVFSIIIIINPNSRRTAAAFGVCFICTLFLESIVAQVACFLIFTIVTIKHIASLPKFKAEIEKRKSEQLKIR